MQAWAVHLKSGGAKVGTFYGVISRDFSWVRFYKPRPISPISQRPVVPSVFLQYVQADIDPNRYILWVDNKLALRGVRGYFPELWTLEQGT